MVKLTVLYGHPHAPEAFEDYYPSTHMPMVRRIPNLLVYEAATKTRMGAQAHRGSDRG